VVAKLDEELEMASDFRGGPGVCAESSLLGVFGNALYAV
jgi:hypothetical protein